IDLVSVDTGSMEDDIVEEALDGLRQKARVLQVGTATAESHARVGSLLQGSGWLTVFDYPPAQDWKTPFGAVHFDAGLHVYVNRGASGELELFGGAAGRAALAPKPPGLAPAPTRVWIDVGAHLGEKTSPVAGAAPGRG